MKEKAEKVFLLSQSSTSAKKWWESKKSVLSTAALFVLGDPMAEVLLHIL